MRHRAPPWLLFLLLLLAAPPPLAAQETPPGYEQGIYELLVSGLAPVSLPVLISPRGGLLVPLRPVLELAGIPFDIVAGSGRVSVARPRGVGTATLDAATRVLEAESRTTLEEGELVAAAGDLYLSPAALALLLEAQVVPDEAELRLTLTRDPPFPAVERLELQGSRAAQLARRGALDDGERLRVPFLPRTGGGVVEWGVSSMYPGVYRPSGVFGRLGMSVLGGMARVGASAADPSGTGLGRPELSAAFQRVFPNGNIVRQVQLGDVVAEGLQARSIRGFTVSNAPFVRDALFGEAVFRPELPTGWEYELYQEGQLLGFSEAGQGAAIRIPLRYGSTPVQVRLFGPAGERITSELVYLVPVLQLPAGRWQYAGGAGLCPGEECRTYSFADLRHGLSQWVTLFAGTEVIGDSVGTTVRPYGGASLIPARGWVVELQGMHRSFLQASVQNFGLGRLSGAASAGVTYPDRGNVTLVGNGGFPLFPSSSRRWHGDATVRARLSPRAWVRGLAVSARADGLLDEVDVDQDSVPERGVDRVQLSAAATLRRLLVETTFERTRFAGELFLGRVSFPVFAGPTWLRSSVVSAALGYDGEQLRRWEVTASAQPRGANVYVTSRWNRDSEPVVLAGVTLRTGFGRAQARTLAQAGQPTSAAFSADGAVTFGECTGVTPLRYGGLGLAGITGFVFRDADGDGRFGADEEAVTDAAVGIGGLRARTDSTGRYRTWSVLPYEIVRVGLDTVSLVEPAWVPAQSEAFLRPSPHLYTRVDFPLVQTREMTGALVPGPGVPTAGAVTLEIVNAATGETQRTVTFSDGEFYVGRVRPGTYEIRVAASSLRALGAVALPASTRVVVPASGDEPLVEVAPIRLVRGTPGAAVPALTPDERVSLAPAIVPAPGCGTR